MKAKTKAREVDPLATRELPVHTFVAGDVIRILNIAPWRLQKFLNSPQYQLSASGQLGRGRGSRRTFNEEDLYRIAVVEYLLKDRFAPEFVGDVLQVLEKDDLLGIDAEANVVSSGLKFVRGEQEPEIRFIRAGENPRIGEAGVYYLLPLDQIIKNTNGAINAFVSRRKKSH